MGIFKVFKDPPDSLTGFIIKVIPLDLDDFLVNPLNFKRTYCIMHKRQYVTLGDVFSYAFGCLETSLKLSMC